MQELEMSFVVKSRSKTLKDTTLHLTGSENLTLDGVLKMISNENRKINQNRLRLTYLKGSKQILITSDKFFEEGISEDDVELFVKDLGPQVAWRLVFFVEYIGPILIHSILYKLSQQPYAIEHLHSETKSYNPFLNKLSYTLVMVHYFKREFETLFVHQFSQSTMPLFNIFKNSFHYWILNGSIALGYFGYGFVFRDYTLYKAYSTVKLNNLKALVALFFLSECWNFYVHLKLRSWGNAQKAKGVTKRVPINTGLFKLFVAPNYTFESWAWIWFTLIFKMNIFAVIFAVVSVVQMYLWAQKKNKKYGTKRAFLIPYVF